MNRSIGRSISHYRVTPILVRAGALETVTIEGVGTAKRFDDSVEYTVTFIPREIYDADCTVVPTVWDSVRVHAVDGKITVSYCFEYEQEWLITVVDEKDTGKKPIPAELHVYSLEPDLYERTPYVGDMHVHTCRSDGIEDPAVVAANYRKAGFDFLAITDHHKWTPSDEAMKAYADLPLGFKMFHGEEVHVPKPSWRLHVVNFGSKYSVNDLYWDNPEEVTARVEAEAKTLTTPKGVNTLEYAWRKWAAEEIRRSGGLCIVAHPYWIYRQTYNMSSAMLDYVFETGLYDAFELVGGVSVHGANLQTAFYTDQREKGRRIPVVGSSDAHGTDPASATFMTRKTIVFAKELELSEICKSIKDMYSVAVEVDADLNNERVYGSYRLVKYARFLIDRYFPTHDELCVEEGIKMREYVMGDSDAGKSLCELSDRTERYMRKMLRG